MCFVRSLTDEEFYLTLGYNVSVPAYVRQGMFSRSFDNDDLLPRIRKPVLITHGDADAVVSVAVIDRQMRRITHAQMACDGEWRACLFLGRPGSVQPASEEIC